MGNSMEDFYEQLVKESPYIAGDNYTEHCDGSQIKWLDEKLLQKGRDFVRRNSFSVMVVQIIATLFSFSYKPFSSVIIRGGKLSQADNTYTRNVANERHIVSWYESDILTPDGKGFHDIQYIRKLHMNGLKRVQRVPLKLLTHTPMTRELMQALQKDLEEFVSRNESPLHLFTYLPTVYMNQFDIAMVQFVLFGRVCLFPEIYGIRDTTGLDGFIHMWALIGRLMGLQDRFNIALHGNKELFTKLFKNIVVSFIYDSDATALVMQETFNTAVSRLYTSGSFRSTVYFGLRGMKSIYPKFTGENIYKTMDWKDKIHVMVLQVILFLVYYFDSVRIGMNHLMNYLISSYGKTVSEYNQVNSEKKSEFW